MMKFRVVINFKDGCRAWLRADDFPRYADGKLMACGNWRVTRKPARAAELWRVDAEEWVNDLHSKQPHMGHRGVSYAEIFPAVPVKKRRSKAAIPLCRHHNPKQRRNEA